MRITYFRLKGYIKVLNGMGLEEIVIPFSEFKNRILLIQGENGCSKSTIIAALSPNPDTSDDFRTDVFIDNNGNRQIIEYPAEKEIHYEAIDESTGFMDHYAILIQSIVDESRTRRTTKAFISKNGEELNPNGNVSSFKEIRDSVLGIDPIYLDLSSISSENRGIVDMIPSERRKYMAAYIGSLDTYNNIFKVISKKVNSLKSYMNTLNGKIYEIGDENELRLSQMQLETNLNNFKEQRDQLLKDLSEAESIVRVVDPDNKMQDLYASISERLVSINNEITQNRLNLGQVSTLLGVDPENTDFISLEKESKESYNKYKDSMTEDKSQINTLISLNEATNSQLESDRTILSGLSTNTIQDNIESAVNDLKNEILVYKSYLAEDDIKILNNISIDELTDLRESLNNFKSEIESAKELYTFEEFCVALDSNIDIKSKINDNRNTIMSNEISISKLNAEFDKINSDLKQLKDFENTRPSDCTIDTCPYISKFIKLKTNNNLDTQLKDIESNIINLKNQNMELNKEIETLEHIDIISRRLDIALSIITSKKNVISKVAQLCYLNNIGKLKSKLRSHYNFQDFDIVSTIIEKSYTFIDMKKAEENLKNLEGDLNIYLNNKSLIDSLKASIDKNEKEYATREEKIKVLNKEYLFLDGLIKELDTKLENISNAITYSTNLNSLNTEKSELRNEFEAVKDKIKLVKEKLDSVNSIKENISRIDEAISPLSEKITEIKFSLANIVNYQQEYKDSSEKYDKMVFIRNACSPGNGMGIQSEYIKRYMNDIIIDCNKMLGYMFGGTIQLDVPIINEKQFSIPFVGPNGIIVPDISNGSTAQKCMIGLVFSCVAMMKSSVKYNIPRFDEIDGGLDQGNRITFINVLNQILDFMNSEQCIICSHNMEFDTQSTTRLLFSHSGIRIEQ